MRPKNLTRKDSAEIYSWRHAAEFLDKKLNVNPDYIVSVPTTSPLRNVSDIDRCIEKAVKNNLDIVHSITPSSRNPYFNMLVKRRGKLNTLSKKSPFALKRIWRRQDAPKCYDLTTVCYVFKPSYIKKTLDLFSGKVGYVIVPKERSLDIDDLIMK